MIIMEFYDELKTLNERKCKIDLLVEKSESIQFYSRTFAVSKEFVGIKQYRGFGDIEDIIGEKKLIQILDKFRSSIVSELNKKRKETEKDLSKYKIIK